MARFKRNYTRGRTGNIALRFITFTMVLIGILWVLKIQLNHIDTSKWSGSPVSSDPERRFFLPTSNGQVIHHRYYSLSYLEEHEQAEWVAYKLHREDLKLPNVDRYDRFESDHAVKTRSAEYDDYTGSGYTRGHLAPAGDMAQNMEAMKESFLMSNISPQKRAFNNGIWKELEEQTRDWAFSIGSVYVVTGPVLTLSVKERIGDNGVSVPSSYFKIILDLESGRDKAIAFLIPNEMSIDPLMKYIVSIDSLESITGIDFFPELLNDREEEDLESEPDVQKWNFSDKRYKLRIEKWNYQ